MTRTARLRALGALLAVLATTTACGSLFQGRCADGYVDDGASCQPASRAAAVTPAGEGGGATGISSGSTGSTITTTSSSTSSVGGAGGGTASEGGAGGGGPTGGGHVLGGGPGDPVAPGAAGAFVEPCRTADGSVLGMDFSGVTPGSPEARLLGNAVFHVAAEPVRVLDYRELAEWNASSVTNVVDLIASEALARGRTVKTTVAHDAADAREKLVSGEFDLFFVHDLASASPGVLAALGASFHDPLDTFGHGCRAVVVLATAQGAGEMGAFLTASGVLEVKGVTEVAAAGVTIAAPADPLAAGLTPPFAEPQALASFALGTPSGLRTTVLATTDGAPVAVHRIW
jgi:hypothetical protein